MKPRDPPVRVVRLALFSDVVTNPGRPGRLSPVNLASSAAASAGGLR